MTRKVDKYVKHHKHGARELNSQRMMAADDFKEKMQKLKDIFEIQKTKMKESLHDEMDRIFRRKCKSL